MQIVVDGLITEYKKSGKGPLLLFLHGWGDSSKTFDGLVAKFESAYTCVRLDLPGFGASEIPEGVWSLGSYADFVQHFLQKISVGSVFALVGHSNGGAIALKGLESGTLQADKLILLASSGIRPKKTIKISLIKVGAKVGKQLTKILPRANQQALRKALYKKIGSDYLAAPQMAATFKKVVREDISQDLPQVAVPVLLVYGEADTDTPLWIARKFAALLPQADLHVVKLAGHFVHHDALAETQQAMEEFLK